MRQWTDDLTVTPVLWFEPLPSIRHSAVFFFRADNDMERVSANLNQAKMFSYVQLIRWEQMGQCDENVMVFYSVEDNVVSTGFVDFVLRKQ